MIYEKKNSGIHVYIIDYGFIIIFYSHTRNQRYEYVADRYRSTYSTSIDRQIDRKISIRDIFMFACDRACAHVKACLFRCVRVCVEKKQPFFS